MQIHKPCVMLPLPKPRKYLGLQDKQFFQGFFLRFMCGTSLLIAAVMKGSEVITNPLAGGPLFGSRWELIVGIDVEVLLGITLVLGLYQAAVRRLAIVCFALFAGINLRQYLTGNLSCGCFGRVLVHPAYTLAFDILSITGLVHWRPSSWHYWSLLLC
jgi:hypothetical protein